MNTFMRIVKQIILTTMIFSHGALLSIVVGSETSVGLQPLINFPSADLDNTLLGYGWFKNGFTLEDQNTTATFDSVFPISGVIALNGGMLILKQDLHFSNITTFSTSGRIVGNGHITEFPTSVTDFPEGNNIFQDAVVFVNNDISLTATLTFIGDCVLQCDAHTLDLNSGAIVVDAGSSLRITNATLKNIEGSNIQCVDEASTLILDNLSWWQSDSLLFSQGSFRIKNNVMFEGNHALIYQSTQPSTILSDASLTFDRGFTFSYDTSDPNLLVFEDKSSNLILRDATWHIGLVGFNFKKGIMHVYGNSFLSVEKTEETDNGITLGDCSSSENDFTFHFTSGSQLTFSGTINYKNIDLNSWIMDHYTAVFYLSTESIFNVYKTLDMGPGVTIFGLNTVLGFAPDQTIEGGISQEGGLTFTELESC
jgi:hypothetical protein